MKQKKLWTGFWSAAGIFLLILDGKTALSGAQAGISLCIRSVIPSLFPFFLLTGILNNALIGVNISFLRPAAEAMGIPQGGESLLIPAFLGGYPMGARALSDAKGNGQISSEDASRLLYFCSNAGPAFIFGMLSTAFEEKWMLWCLWGIHIVSAFMVSQIVYAHPRKMTVSEKPQASLSEVMNSAIGAMSAVCGWVICFRVITTVLGRWFLWRLPVRYQVLTTGLLELTNGCAMLELIPTMEIRFLISACLLSAGGCCVAMQTANVIGSLPMRSYLIGKFLQTGISLLLALSVIYRFWPLALFICILTSTLRHCSKKRSGKSIAFGV